VPPEATDHAQAHRTQNRRVADFFASVDVGELGFDDRLLDSGDSIA
jgi:hypothetical protein